MKFLLWQPTQRKPANRLRGWSMVMFLGLIIGISLGRSNPWVGEAWAQNTSPQPATAPIAVGGLDLKLTASSLKPGHQSALIATLRDNAGQPRAGELVVFYGGLGTVNPASAVTDAEGRVNAIYTAGSRGGKAQITVLAGYTSQSVALQIEGTGNQPGGGHRLFLPTVAR